MSAVSTQERDSHTLWGLTPEQLHARFWKARGVQVVPNQMPEIVVDRRAELYLLVDHSHMVIMPIQPLLDVLYWLKPDLLVVRVADRASNQYRELVDARADGHFLRFRRSYEGNTGRLARVALTTDPDIARDWASMESARASWSKLRRLVPSDLRSAMAVDGRVYANNNDSDRSRFVRDLTKVWRHPDATISRVQRLGSQSWRDVDAPEMESSSVAGPIWIGAGRTIPEGKMGVGPAVLWDDPASRPETEANEIDWRDIQTMQPRSERQMEEAAKWTQSPARRVFDVLFALCALAVTLPLYPIIIAAIFIEDRSPIFFGHKRETTNGREFKCWKFRTMYRDAEKMKAQLQQQNEADGPQFFMEHDPRITKVGRVLRKLQLDELPQFFNVLLGQMSVVGPRPSPFSENQYCPGWREARLSVRPGVTGLWQIRRTRADGADFQEWIRYDIEYVEQASFWLDVYIIWKTIALVASALARR